MGNRLTKIYTRTGDSGTTSLGDGRRVAKSSIQIEAYGTLDELNSHIGVVLAMELPADIRCFLEEVQQVLFDLGSELCMPGTGRIVKRHISSLENQLDRLNDGLPHLKEFILPGGNPSSAACHVARTVCRRCERITVALAEEVKTNPLVIEYLNRLSDLLFVAARVLARKDGGSEILWDPRRMDSV